MMSNTKASWIKSGVIGLLTFIIYAYTTPQGLTWDLGGTDGGELATAVYTGGLVHSPGYPTYLLAAQVTHLFSFIEPVAYRLNLFSALCMSLATAVLAHLCQRISKHSLSVFPPFLFGLTPLVWSQAIISEVYALAALFCALFLHTPFSLRENTSTQKGILLGILFGVGLGAHYMIIFPMLFLLIYTQLEKQQWLKFDDRKSFIGLSLGTVLGLLVFLYLPLQAGNTTHSNWGNPDSFSQFWWVVSGAAYYGRFQISTIPTYATSVLGTMIQSVGLVGSVFAAWGLAQWWEQEKSLFWASIITIVANTLIVSGYNSADVLPYLYPSMLLLILALTEGLTQAHTQLKASSLTQKTEALITTALLSIIIAPVAWGGWETAQSATREADLYGQNILNHVEPKSVLLTQGTQQSFALRYATAVTRPEKEVTVIDIDLWEGQAWYRTDIEKALSLRVSSETNTSASTLISLMHENDYAIYSITNTVSLPIRLNWVQQNGEINLWRLRPTS